MRGTCVWNVSGDLALAANEFLRAAELCDDEDKLAAARVRGYLLKGSIPEALTAARAAQERFPDSISVWLALTNARTLAGEAVGADDIPPIYQGYAAAYLVVAAGIRRAGDLAEALRLVTIAVGKEDANFFAREAFLRYALDTATTSPLNTVFRITDNATRVALERAVDLMSPRTRRLWSEQSTEAVSAASTHLAYAHLLLGNPAETLLVVGEAAAHQVDTAGTLIRPQIEALRDLHREQEALTVGRPLLSVMPLEALVSYAQTAANVLDHESLDAAAASAGERDASDPRTLELRTVLQLLRWDVMIRSGASQVVRQEIDNAHALQSTSIPTLVVAAKAFLQSDEPRQADPYIARALQLSDSSPEPGNQYMLGQVLFAARRYADAAARYASVLSPGAVSEVHADLLFCYLRSGQRSKARELIASFPETWTAIPTLRRMALELAQLAGDWDLMGQLIQPQLQDEPGSTLSWLLRLMVAARKGKTALTEAVALLPEYLEGSIRETAQLASTEFQNGQAVRGMRRIYRMRRLNLGSTEAAAAHFTAIAFAPGQLPGLDESPGAVAPGTSALLVDEAGRGRWKTVDPSELEGLPSTEEFCSAGSPEAKALIGKAAGDTLSVQDGIGGLSTFRVERITSAHQRLSATSDEFLRTSVATSTIASPVTFETDEAGEVNFSPIVRNFERRGQRNQEMYRAYNEGGLTLGGLGRLLGRDVVDLIRDWPREDVLLDVGGGVADERDRAIDVLRGPGAFVVDMSALCELALVGKLSVLAALPRLVVASATLDIVERKLDEHQTIRKGGVAFTRDGEFGFQEITDADRETERRFLESIRDAIGSYCRVVPAYGPADVSTVIVELGKAISHEEYSVLLVALEHGASVLTLDARLRRLARLLGVPGAWPQALLLACRGVEVSHRDYSLAAVQMFFRRRTFVTLDATDLLTMTDQGDAWLLYGLNRLRAHLELPTVDFQKAASVVVEYLSSLYGRGYCQGGVVLELFSYLLESLLRHPACPPNYAHIASVELFEWLGRPGPETEYLEFIKLFADHALKRRKVASKEVVSLALKVIYCSAPPTLKSGLVNSADPSGQLERAAPPGVVSSAPQVHAVTAGTSTDDVL
jgi:tetratricopeptide (TPR) repeat protein